jgi:hypothetical protein
LLSGPYSTCEDTKLNFSTHSPHTDIIIDQDSCHPYEHKLSSICYLLNRLHIYPIIKEAKETTWNTTPKQINTAEAEFIKWKPRLPIKIHRTGRKFNNRYKGHVQAITNNDSNCGYPNHISNTGHTYGTTTNITDIIKRGKKGKHLHS